MIKERTLPDFNATTAQITKEEGLRIYEDMMLGRLFEDKCAEMYYRGKMFGFVHLYNGQEAVSSGVIKTMRSGEDFVCSTYRDHVHALSAGVPAKEVMAELFGKATGCSKGRGGSMHMFSASHRLLGGYAFIAEGIPVAAGAAFQTKYRREVMGDESADQVTAAFFGDGACNNGQFYETLNMAALWKLPIIFVVENNKWAIGMSHERATSVPEIYKKAGAFGMPGVEVDGMDVLAVRSVAQEAVLRARAGEGPTLIEALTYRFRGHSLADPDEMRSKEEKELWFSRDPIKKLTTYLVEQNLATLEELKDIERKIQATIDEAVEFAESSPEPDPSELYRFIFAEDE
ncbi:MAG: pyruvate dehydrogenase (acetyl-transferring) E1 component subunit alpha [Rivularia sp. (in: cyanobacteria)]